VSLDVVTFWLGPSFSMVVVRSSFVVLLSVVVVRCSLYVPVLGGAVGPGSDGGPSEAGCVPELDDEDAAAVGGGADPADPAGLLDGWPAGGAAGAVGLAPGVAAAGEPAAAAAGAAGDAAAGSFAAGLPGPPASRSVPCFASAADVPPPEWFTVAAPTTPSTRSTAMHAQMATTLRRISVDPPADDSPTAAGSVTAATFACTDAYATPSP